MQSQDKISRSTNTRIAPSPSPNVGVTGLLAHKTSWKGGGEKKFASVSTILTGNVE